MEECKAFHIEDELLNSYVDTASKRIQAQDVMSAARLSAIADRLQVLEGSLDRGGYLGADPPWPLLPERNSYLDAVKPFA
jgi:hypothetical protein